MIDIKIIDRLNKEIKQYKIEIDEIYNKRLDAVPSQKDIDFWMNIAIYEKLCEISEKLDKGVIK